MEIYRFEISDILNSLPDIHELEMNKTYDIYICTLGFEDRTHHVISQLTKEMNTKESVLILITYPTNQIDNEKNKKYFDDISHRFKILKILPYTRQNFYNDLFSLLNEFIPIHKTVAFDISTCSSYVFYPTLKLLMDYDIDLTICYSEAEIYCPTEEEWEDVAMRAAKEDSLFVQSFENAQFLSIGIDDVYPCTLFSEMNPDNKATILAAIPNFSAMRMNAIMNKDREINKTSLERTHWICGQPPAGKNKWRMEAVKKTNNLDNIKASHILSSSTLDYKDMIKTLENIWLANRYEYYMSIGSLGSKMQHLGTYMFMNLHPDTGLWLSEPKEFRADRFSAGYGPAWQISFGRAIDINFLLKKYMTFQWRL
jgi:hypothetical protein